MMGTESVLAYYREDLATSSGFPDPGKVWARFRKGEVSAQPGTGETSTPTGLRAALGKNRDDTIRTCDHLLPKQALYQLSYIPWGVKSSTSERNSERDGCLFDKNLAKVGVGVPSGPYPTSGSKWRSKSTKGHVTQEATTAA